MKNMIVYGIMEAKGTYQRERGEKIYKKLEEYARNIMRLT